jgi:hypothetical protein
MNIEKILQEKIKDTKEIIRSCNSKSIRRSKDKGQLDKQ